MGERDDKNGGGSPLPSSGGSSRKPTIIRPASKLLPECPPRPANTPRPLSGSVGPVKAAGNQTSNRKLEITIVDARPMSEIGFKDVKMPAVNSTPVSNHPAPSGDTFTHNMLDKEHKGEDNSILASLSTGGAGDNYDENDEEDMRAVRKPSLQLRPQKPTIIRPQSRLQSTSDLTPAAETPPEHLYAQINKNKSSTPQSSLAATVSPSVPDHPLPSPKPRLRDPTSVSSDPQIPIQIAAEKKQTPPARPPSIWGSDLSSQKPTPGPTNQPMTGQVSSVKTDKILQSAPSRPPSVFRSDLSAHKSVSEESDKTTFPNSSSTVTSPVQIQPPKRPSGPPCPNLLGSRKSKEQREVNINPTPEIDKQATETARTSVDIPQVVSPPSVNQQENAFHKKENIENKSVLPKPKPRPKPRPTSITSPGVKEETQSVPADSVDSILSQPISPSNLSLPDTSPHDTQVKVQTTKTASSLMTSGVRKPSLEEHSSPPERPKPLTTSKPLSTIIAAKTETSQVKEEESVKPLPTAPSVNKKPGPAVHKPPSSVSHMQQAPLSQLPSITSGEPTVMPSPPRRAKHQASSQQNPAPQAKPPPRPASSVPAKIKQPFVSEKPPLVSEKQPFVSEKPPLVSEKPPFVSEKPPSVSEKPPSVSEKPPSVSEKPPFVSEKPPSVSEKPPFVSEKPPFVDEKPPFVSEKPPFVSEKPPQSSDSISSSHEVPGTELATPSKPAASRGKREAPPLPKRPGPGHPLYSYMSKEAHGIAIHDYTASQPDELSLSEGDVAILVKDVDENWRSGQVGDNVGIFPAAFVEMKQPIVREKSGHSVDNLDSGTATGKSREGDVAGPRCRARFDFEGDGDTELPLQDGDVVQIIEKIDDEWLRGQHRGRQGIFPTSFVEVIEDLPPDGSMGGNSVSALFDFDGKDGELSFKAGDEISEIHQINSDWLFGHCNGQKGQFPASFVSTIPPNLHKQEQDLTVQAKDEPKGNAKEDKATTDTVDEFWDSRETALGFCIAMFDYTDPSPGDLEFKKRDRIKILEFIGEDWARGRLGNREGLFPLRFVAEELNSPPPSPEPEVVVKVLGKVVHDFDGETVDDLTIKEGDIIEVGDFADVNKNWRWGTLNGQKGMFPVAFVDIME